MNRNKILVLILISFLISCGNNPQNNKNKESTTEESIIKANDIIPEKEKNEQNLVRQERDMYNDRDMATKELNLFLSSAPKPWPPLVINYYVVDFLSEGQGAPKDVLDIGEWYKFDENFNYKHGFFDKETDSGKYSMDIDKKLLLMLPSDKNLPPSEWKILNSGDVIVMIGTAKFGNNPIQKHCQNVSNRPEIQ